MLKTILVLTLVSLTLQLSIPVRDSGKQNDNNGLQQTESLLNTVSEENVKNRDKRQIRLQYRINPNQIEMDKKMRSGGFDSAELVKQITDSMMSMALPLPMPARSRSQLRPRSRNGKKKTRRPLRPELDEYNLYDLYSMYEVPLYDYGYYADIIEYPLYNKKPFGTSKYDIIDEYDDDEYDEDEEEETVKVTQNENDKEKQKDKKVVEKEEEDDEEEEEDEK